MSLSRWESPPRIPARNRSRAPSPPCIHFRFLTAPPHTLPFACEFDDSPTQRILPNAHQLTLFFTRPSSTLAAVFRSHVAGEIRRGGRVRLYCIRQYCPSTMHGEEHVVWLACTISSNILHPPPHESSPDLPVSPRHRAEQAAP